MTPTHRAVSRAVSRYLLYVTHGLVVLEVFVDVGGSVPIYRRSVIRSSSAWIDAKRQSVLAVLTVLAVFTDADGPVHANGI